MNLSISQYIFLFFLKLILGFLNILEKITSFDLRPAVKKIGNILIYSVPFLLLITLGYFIYSGDLNEILEYKILERNYVSKENLKAVTYFPVLKNGNVTTPNFTADSVLIYEARKGKILYSYNPDLKHAQASTTKLMTAIVARELYDLNDYLKATTECYEIPGNKIWLPVDEIFTVKDILYAMLVGSANDAACLLANSKVSQSVFVDQMNIKAEEYGLADTHFSNPIGFDSAGGDNYSTANDLYKLSKAALADAFISEAVKTPVYLIKALNSEYYTNVYSTNDLLWQIPGTTGVKTGTTQNAGEVLIYKYEDGMKSIVIIVMGSEDRFNDTRSLLSWVASNYRWD